LIAARFAVKWRYRQNGIAGLPMAIFTPATATATATATANINTDTESIARCGTLTDELGPDKRLDAAQSPKRPYVAN
jgi:hypothetical protein